MLGMLCAVAALYALTVASTWFMHDMRVYAYDNEVAYSRRCAGLR
jgi:hypothetical protein